MLDEMLGLGPLERLLNDDGITDIMVNGYKQVYVERKGKLELTDVAFRNDDHVMNIAQRIVAKIGRRVRPSLSSMRASKTAAASTLSCRPWRSADRPSRFVSSPRSPSHWT